MDNNAPKSERVFPESEPSQTLPQIADDAKEANNAEKSELTRRQFVLRNAALFGSVALGEAIGRPRLPEITRYRIRMPGLRSPVRLVQLTDFHRSWCVSEWYLAECVRMANRLKPDVAALTGDFVTRHSDYAVSCAEILKNLQAPLGLYGTLGNHDHWCDNKTGADAVSEIMTAAGIQMLTNRNVKLENGLRIVGVDDQWTGFPDWQTAFRGVAPTEPTLALTHNPNLFKLIPHVPCTLLAGHTHGGQINIPPLMRKIFGGQIRYLKGWFTGKQGVNRMYVSRGLGVVTVPFRFNAPPEMTLFYLEPG